ncbi:TrbI/VirB10 family protein [Pseudomonas fluorescens]|uniref:TrbI/VirB10 family protein n=1 Tax=Pseudomonas fluorescens TaxID=294 RepID=UPI00372D2AAF
MRMPWNRKDEFEEEELEEQQPIEGDRKIASVNKGLGMQARLTNIVAGICIIAFGGWFLFHYYAGLYQERQEKKDRDVDKTQTASNQLPPLKVGALETQQQPAGQAAPPQPNMQARSGTANGQPVKSPAEIEREGRLSSPVKFKLDGMASSLPQAPTNNATQTGTDGQRGAGGQAGAGGQPGQPGMGSAGNPGDRLSQSLQSAQMDPVEAYRLGDPGLMVYQGEAIPCVVRPALDSSLPGMVQCVQSDDLWSADHSAIVAERGTIYTGQQLMGLARGNRRLPIVWTRGRTPMPNNVAFNLSSAATDELGRTGVTGDIDYHLAERWGPIVALSVIDDVGAYLQATQQSNSGNNTTLNLGNTTNGGQDLATEIFKEAANIPNTLTRNQGANIYIYVARDIDFNKVYSLEYKQ